MSVCRSSAEFKGNCKTVKLFAKHMKVHNFNILANGHGVSKKHIFLWHLISSA